MAKLSKDFILAIPKTDLHLHLDGSLRLNTLIELAKKGNVKLPSYTAEGLYDTVFKEKYADLNEYLTGFAYTGKVLQTPENLERVAYELAVDNFAEGVRYIEIRFAPHLHMNKNMGFEKVLSSVDNGLRQARDQINLKLGPDEPPFEYGIIVCAMRFFNERFSEYYQKFIEVHKYSSQEEIMQMASLELAKATVNMYRETDVQIVGIDLAGSEYGYPASNHRKAYYYIHKNFLKKTVHAGEAYGPESIFQSITKLNADRIGHGLHLFDISLIDSEKISDKERYIRELANYIADRRITIEVCLTSNLQTVPEIKSLRDHSFGKMLENKLSVTLCTDNRLVSRTTVSKEIELALNNFDISSRQLKNMIIYGFKRSFYYKPYSKKREYVRKVINYYETIEKQFGIAD